LARLGALTIGHRHLDRFNIFLRQIGYFTDSRPQNSPQDLWRIFRVHNAKKLRIYLHAG
jgi:hypothetical protein